MCSHICRTRFSAHNSSTVRQCCITMFSYFTFPKYWQVLSICYSCGFEYFSPLFQSLQVCFKTLNSRHVTDIVVQQHNYILLHNNLYGILKEYCNMTATAEKKTIGVMTKLIISWMVNVHIFDSRTPVGGTATELMDKLASAFISDIFLEISSILFPGKRTLYGRLH